jgi:hypothetical protein
MEKSKDAIMAQLADTNVEILESQTISPKWTFFRAPTLLF